MYLFSDLDNTLIFSKRALSSKSTKDNLVAVESNNGIPVTYVTKKSYVMLLQLLSDGLLIPVTTRTLSQMNRISMFSEHKSKTFICSNGAEIYINGRLDMKWAKYVQDKISHLSISIQDLCKTCKPELLKIRDGFFVQIENSPEFKNLYKDTYEKIVNLPDFYMCESGRKLYVMPKFLQKSEAVKYVMKEIGITQKDTVCAGDSNMDICMKQCSILFMTPNKSNVLDKRAYRTIYSGIESGEEILSAVYNANYNSNEI